MNCPVCLSYGTALQLFTGRDVLFETTPRTFALSGCGSCRSLFINPLPSEEELADFYPSRYWWTPSPGPLSRLERIYRRIVLRDHLAFIMRASQIWRITNVPCDYWMSVAVAPLCWEPREEGFEVLGFDASLEAAAVAKADHGVEVVTGARLQDANFPNADFDVVTLFHVMEHVPDPRDVLAEVRRILRAGGRMVLQVPNVESWQSRLFGVRWYGLDVPRHVINYSSRAMHRLLSDSGFRVRRSRHFNLRDNAPALASSLFPSLDPGSRRVRLNRKGESGVVEWGKHTLYLATVISVLPFAVAESLAGFGATVMIEAEKV